LAQARPRFGYLRLHVMLSWGGWVVNRKRVSHLRVVPPSPSQVNERWSIDFVADTLLDDRRFREPTVVANGVGIVH